jgi:hypothetical protein
VDGILRGLVRESQCPDEEFRDYLAYARAFYHTVREPPIPEFSSRTKAVVMFWFRRGLSGKTLWQIGASILRWLHPAIKEIPNVWQ